MEALQSELSNEGNARCEITRGIDTARAQQCARFWRDTVDSSAMRLCIKE